MSAELKPCPFCGGKPTVNSRSNGYAEIGCEPCGVWTSSTNNDEHLQTWNRRAAPQPSREAVIQCEHCDGDGTEPHTDNDVTGPQACSVCEGSGNVIVRALASAPSGEAKEARIPDSIMEHLVVAFNGYNEGKIDADECVCLMATAAQIVMGKPDAALSREGRG